MTEEECSALANDLARQRNKAEAQARKAWAVADHLAKAGEHALTWFQLQSVDSKLREALAAYRQAKDEAPDA